MLKLTTDDNASELSTLETKLACDVIADTVRSQLSTFASTTDPAVRAAIAAMRASLGPTMYERLVRDIASNVVQSLIA